MKVSSYFLKSVILFFIVISMTIAGLKSQTLYSYMSGNWNNLDTWTTDPGGTTLVGSRIPTNGDVVVILMSRTVTLTADTATTNLDITIRSGGILNLGANSFTAGLSALRGEGTIKLSGTNFPSATTNTFVDAGGGTTEYNNSSDFTLPVLQTEYNNLTLNLSSTAIVATQLSDITLNGNLYIKKGKYQINNEDAARWQLSVGGNVTVDSGSSLKVGEGNTATTTNPVANTVAVDGGTAPFLNYYDQNTHRVVIYGDFTNNGTVRFTNQDYPDYNSFPTSGAATVYFLGTTDNILTCNDTTDFYNLVVDKGTDQTYQLAVNSSDYYNFRLFGANIAGGENGGDNPDLKKALWIRNGTLLLFGKVVIPSLSEGSCGDTDSSPNTDFYIPANAALVIDGPDVIVLTTADNYREVNAAYGTSAASDGDLGINASAGCSSFSILGKFQINDGYISTRESGGFIYWASSSGEFIINGGTLDTKQFRTANTSGGLTAYRQTGGTFTLRGRFIRNVTGVSTIASLTTVPLSTTQNTGGIQAAVGTFNIDRDDNIFDMSGGTIEILDVCGVDASSISRVYEVNSLPAYYNVTGGNVTIKPTDGTGTDYNYYIASAAPVYNLNIERVTGTSSVQLTNIPSKTGVTARTNPPLTVSNDLTLSNNATLVSNNYQVQVGGDFSLPLGSTYTPGTNWTTFNGAGYQTFTGNGTITSGFNKLKIDKSADTIIFVSTLTTFTIRDSLQILGGTLNDGGKTLNVAGHIYCAGKHTGTGEIVLNGGSAQYITYEVFGEPGLGNVTLNNANGANLVNDGSIESFTFTSGMMYLGQYRLTIESGVVSGYTTTRYFRTNGVGSDGGLRMGVNASSLTTGNNLVYPIGVTGKYTPCTIMGNTSPGTGNGYVTFTPVNNIHPAQNTSGRHLYYYWRSNSTGLPSGSNVYFQCYNNIVGDWESGVNTAYTLISGTTSWNSGGSASRPNVIINGIANSQGFISADITAGNSGAFNNVDVFYSIASGAFSSNDVWSSTAHDGADCNCHPNSASDIIYIGGIAGRNDSITVTAGFNAATITILGSFTGDERRPTLNIQNFGGSITLDLLKGAGKFVTTSATIPTTDYGDFTGNDSAVFNYHGGSYTIGTTITSYPTLLITSNANNITKTLPNSNVLVRKDLIISVPVYTNNTLLYPNASRTLTVYNDIKINNTGRLRFNGNNAQILNIYGDINLRYNNTDNTNIIDDNGGTGLHNVNFYGDSIITGQSSIALDYATLNFLDSANVVVTDRTGGTNTITFDRMVINKDNLSDTVFIYHPLTLDGITNSSPKALALTKGTLVFGNSSHNITLSSGGANFSIPQTAALILKNGAGVSVTGTGTGIFLDGLLRAEDNSVINIGDGTTADTRYIEYSGSGNAKIELTETSGLTVNSQIRRSTTQTNGVLKFNQSGTASTIIYGRGGTATRAKFETVNPGSEFYMSGGSFTILRGGGTSYGDLYLRPESGSATGGTITLGSVDVGVQTIKLDSEVPLNTLILDGVGTDNTFQLMVNPLVMNGNLTINTANSIFDANSNDVTLKGNLTNNGTYVPGTNTTTFNGATQTILGSTVTDFYNLVSNPSTSLTFNYDVTIANDFSIVSGSLLSDTLNIYVAGDVANSGIHSGDASRGGIILNGTSAEQEISGSGTFGRLNLYNAFGARILNDITLEQDLLLSRGILNINQRLLTLKENSDIIDTTGTGFSSLKMVEPDGVFSNVGIKKNFTAGDHVFTYPLGVSGKYTPADLNITANTNAGSIRINCINDNHPTVLDDTQVLQYYWEVASTGISAFYGDLKFKYADTDVAGAEASYVAAQLIIPDGTTWSKASPGESTDNVDETNDTIKFNYNGVNNISGEYTAGNDSAIPATVPVYQSIMNGNWDTPGIWEKVGDPGDGDPAPAGGPNGFIVIVSPGDSVYTNGNRRFAYRTTINGILDVRSTYGHNLGTVYGTGKLRLEGPVLPAGRFTSFLNCSGGTLEFNGSTEYTIIADRIDTLRNLYFTGTNKRILPDKDLIICDTLKISGATLDNSVNNRKLTVNGVFQRINSGAFLSGTGANATVVFAGSAAQTLGGVNGQFTGTNKFNNFELNNSSGLTLNSPLEINEDLLLTDGIITTTSTNILKILNPGASSQVIPDGGSADAYIDGPMSIYIYGGNNFNFPIGDGSRYGKLQLLGVDNGTWIAEYFNTGFGDYTITGTTLTEVSQTEYWAIDNPNATDKAQVELRWDPGSDITPLTTTNGIDDIIVAEFDGTDWVDIDSDAPVGDDYNGTVATTNTIDVDPAYYTLGSKSPILAKAYFTTIDDVCAGESIPVSFSGVTSAELDYTLYYSVDLGVPSSVTITSADLPYSLPAPTSGSYKLTGFEYNNGSNIGNADGSTVSVNPVPAQPTISPDTDQVLCEGESVILSSSIGSTYLWSNGATTQNINVTTAGNYSVQVVNAFGCYSIASDAVAVTVDPLPVFTPSAVPSTICYGDNSQLDANFGGTGATYLWDPVAELDDETLENPVYTPATNPTTPVQITTTFTVTVTSSAGCSDTGTVNVIVNRTPETGPEYHISNDWP